MSDHFTTARSIAFNNPETCYYLEGLRDTWKARYDDFMKAWGEANRDKSREVTKNYPSMRKITGEYLLRKIDIK